MTLKNGLIIFTKVKNFVIGSIYFLLFSATCGAEVPRRVIAFWDSTVERLIDTVVANSLEMPLNHLGLDVVYYDINKPLPTLSTLNDVCGIILYFQPETKIPNPAHLIDWAIEAIDRGIKVVVWRDSGIMQASFDQQNRLYEKLGFVHLGSSVSMTFDYQIIYEDSELIPFEKKYPTILPPISMTQVIGNKAKSYLKVNNPKNNTEKPADLIIINQNGAYINPQYECHFELHLLTEKPQTLGWYINPFLFFKWAFNLSNDPIPDHTTLAGRRILYSICHGDGWNIETSLEEYQKNEETYASQVLLEKVIKSNPDIPMATGIIAADVDPDWVAKSKSQAVAKQYMATPQVELASHTYSHPFEWEFFDPKNFKPEDEINYLYLYPYPTWQNSYLSWFHAQYSKIVKPQRNKKELSIVYTIPRAYANKPFDIDLEIAGSVKFLDALAPPNNQVKILLWSGDGNAWGDAVARCYHAGVKNLGVGSTRFDDAFPSYIFVGPIGRKPEGWVQIYNSSNGDNEYTYEWEKDFYRFSLLQTTLKNTGYPIRVKPMCIYYHSYSGEFEASVRAILSNLEYARSESPISIMPTRFFDIGYGFYTAGIERIENSKWKIRSRRGLQTVRFDRASQMQIDVSHSVGVIGYTTFQGSLYVYLDAAVEEPIISVLDKGNNKEAYLVDSSWEIWGLGRENGGLHFNAKGWGTLQMKWYMPEAGRYILSVGQDSVEASAENNTLFFEIDLPYNEDQEISIRKV